MNIDFPVAMLLSLPLASVRILAMFMAAPIFGHNAVPIRIRVIIGLAFALITAPLVESPAAVGSLDALTLGALVANEVLIGASIGFGIRLIFMVFAPLGEVISIQGGLGAANVLDPTYGTTSPVIGTLLQAGGVVLFLAIDGHHALLRGLSGSFERLPLGDSMLGPNQFSAIVALGGSIFDVAVRLAAPVMVVIFVTNVGVGLLGRAIPQLNLMAIQLPAQIAITLAILALAAAPLAQAIVKVLDQGTRNAFSAVLGG